MYRARSIACSERRNRPEWFVLRLGAVPERLIAIAVASEPRFASNGAMNPKLMILLAAAALALAVGGESRTRSAEADDLTTAKASRVVFEARTVSFSPVKLARGEFIQGISLTLKSCRIVTIGKIPNDWDLALRWEAGNSSTLKGTPGHFASGLSSLKQLDGFITIQFVSGNKAAQQLGPFEIQATVTLEKTIPAGGASRTLSFSRSDLILRPAANN